MSMMMSLMDLLVMSKNSLVRRKLRTMLTVLGVVIGTASIVVMVSLGIGLQQSVYKTAEESGGLTNITVTSTELGMDATTSKQSTKKEKRVTDTSIKELQEIAHVKSLSPILTVPAQLQKGAYTASVQLTGMSEQAIKDLNFPLASGSLPNKQSANMELLVGNMVANNFHEKGNEEGLGMYTDDSETTDSKSPVDFTKDSVFLSITDYNSDGSSQEMGSTMSLATSVKPAKKYLVKASGILKGTSSEWTSYSNNVYVPMENLLGVLKKQMKNGVLPGQPTRKGGKPYPYLVYSSIVLKADNVEHVDSIMKEVKSLGYQVSSNMELINSSKKQFATIQGVLAAIGAVSLFVAAIGITNTMMMSIYERTKEIGVIKVLGCSLKNIQQMFLIEAAFIGFLGGFLGNVLSFIVSFMINTFAAGAGEGIGVSGSLSQIPIWLVLVSVGFSILIGMLAGYFPALRAMKLSPLVAING